MTDNAPTTKSQSKAERLIRLKALEAELANEQAELETEVEVETATVESVVEPVVTAVDAVADPVVTAVESVVEPVVSAAETAAAPVVSTVESAIAPVVAKVEAEAEALLTDVRQWYATGKTTVLGAKFDPAWSSPKPYIKSEFVLFNRTLTADEHAEAVKGGDALAAVVASVGATSTATAETTPAPVATPTTGAAA